ncbi:MAG: thiol-disulfide isomerase/thioredoxin [Myxococcota bacterium]
MPRSSTLTTPYAASPILPLLVALASWLLLLAPISCVETEPAAAPSPPEVAPAFSLPQLGAAPGAQVALASQLGKTVIIDFWATWCVPCEFQVPELNAFYDAHREDSDVALFGASVDTEGEALVAEWVGEKGVRYPILLGGDALAREFGAEGFPTLVVVAPDGTIDSRHVGLIQQEELEEILARLRAAG